LKLTAKKSGAQFSKHYEENPSKIFATSLTYEELRKTMEVLIFKKYIQKSFKKTFFKFLNTSKQLKTVLRSYKSKYLACKHVNMSNKEIMQ